MSAATISQTHEYVQFFVHCARNFGSSDDRVLLTIYPAEPK